MVIFSVLTADVGGLYFICQNEFRYFVTVTLLTFN